MKMTRSDFAIGLLKGSLYLYSWLIICGLWKLITLILHVDYKWVAATCVWVSVCGLYRQFIKYLRMKNDVSYIPQEQVKVGDRVRANKLSAEYNLTPGKEYEVLGHYGIRYAVKNDDNMTTVCPYKCFAKPIRGGLFR